MICVNDPAYRVILPYLSRELHFLKIFLLLEVSQYSSALGSGKKGAKMKMSTEHWCKYANRIK